MKAMGCLNGHAMDYRKMGPTFMDVAAAFLGQKGAEGRALLQDARQERPADQRADRQAGRVAAGRREIRTPH